MVLEIISGIFLITGSTFMLIGFNHESPESRKSALQALLVTFGGGLALLAGIQRNFTPETRFKSRSYRNPTGGGRNRSGNYTSCEYYYSNPRNAEPRYFLRPQNPLDRKSTRLNSSHV